MLVSLFWFFYKRKGAVIDTYTGSYGQPTKAKIGNQVKELLEEWCLSIFLSTLFSFFLPPLSIFSSFAETTAAIIIRIRLDRNFSFFLYHTTPPSKSESEDAPAKLQFTTGTSSSLSGIDKIQISKCDIHPLMCAIFF